MLKTSGYALGIQHYPRDLANVNEWKIMFDLFIVWFSYSVFNTICCMSKVNTTNGEYPIISLRSHHNKVQENIDAKHLFLGNDCACDVK